jgi:hypothetical protein
VDWQKGQAVVAVSVDLDDDLPGLLQGKHELLALAFSLGLQVVLIAKIHQMVALRTLFLIED